MKYTYLLVNFFSFIIPFLFSFHPKINFQKKWSTFIPALLITAVVFILWDIAFTRMGVWHFNPGYVTGYRFINLPLEEILFFICIPYACVFTYHCINLKLKFQLSALSISIITGVLIIFLLSTAAINLAAVYTAVTFISLAVLLIITKYCFNSEWLGKFYIVYLILLIPFLIVNGILTGTGLREPVVIYNNHENLGIRILTIPVEDIFYGMCLILLNVFIYEWLSLRMQQRKV